MSVREFITQSGAETIAVGKQIAQVLPPSRFVILRGELGAGKTTLVKGIAEALDAADQDEVTSPTFTLINEYVGKYNVDSGAIEIEIYHLDLYRIESERQLQTLGLEEIAAKQAIVLVEWGEKFPSVVKRSDGEILLEHAGGDARKVTLRLKETTGTEPLGGRA